MKRLLCSLITLTAVSLLANCMFAQAAAQETDWPTFRGSNRTGMAPDTNLLESWPADGPKKLWEGNDAGRGYASVAIADGKLYTLGDGIQVADDNDEYLLCYDLEQEGKFIWYTKTGPAWNKGKESWQSSRSTPTVDGDLVYVITPAGKLVCVNTEGAEQWRVDLKKKFGGKKADSWGYSESVLIDGDHLVCTPGGPENTMVALNKKTGEKVWSTSRAKDRGAGHASIVISKVGSTQVYVQTTGSGCMGVRASDGKLLWTFDIDRTTAVIPTPIVRDDLVFFAAGYGRGGALLRQVENGDKVSVETVYGLNPKLANKHGGIVLVGDYLYGDSDDKGTPFCADFMTGEIKWKSRGAGRKSIAVCAADGHLYFQYANGTLALVKADPAKMNEVSSFKVPGSGKRPSWAHPVIADGKLYLRENEKIFCYDISAGGSKDGSDAKLEMKDEMLTNGNFAAGMTGWAADKGDPESGKVEVVKDGPKGTSAVRVEIVELPDEPWQVQVFHPGLKIEKGKSYVFSFWIKSKDSDTIKVNCMQNHEPWEHSTEEEFYTSDEWEKKEFEFSGPWSDENARITFTNLGTDEGQVFWFAGCSLKQK